MEKYVKILRKHGIKVTPQRLEILRFLDTHHTHPTAEEIYHELKKSNPALSSKECVAPKFPFTNPLTFYRRAIKRKEWLASRTAGHERASDGGEEPEVIEEAPPDAAHEG